MWMIQVGYLRDYVLAVASRNKITATLQCTVATLICSQAHTDLNKVGGPQRVVRSMPSCKLQTCSDTTSYALSVWHTFIDRCFQILTCNLFGPFSHLPGKHLAQYGAD